jgi:hypothetical protein
MCAAEWWESQVIRFVASLAADWTTPARVPVMQLDAAPDAIREQLAATAPLATSSLAHVADPAVLGRALADLMDTEFPQGLMVVGVEVLNDLVDLAFDALRCRTRPATRTARSLFEHALNARDLEADPTLERRFRAHRDIVAMQLATLAQPITALQGGERRGADHRRRKLLRNSEHRAQQAEAEFAYGGRGWAPQSIRVRADRWSYEDEYTFFRIASAVLHGSSVGLFGVFDEEGGLERYRVGGVIDGVPTALLYGLLCAREALLVLSRAGEAEDWNELLAALSSALDAWPEYRRAVTGLFENHFALGAAGPEQVLCELRRSDTARWFVSAGRFLRAVAPPERIPKWALDSLEVLRPPDDCDYVILTLPSWPSDWTTRGSWRPIDEVFSLRPSATSGDHRQPHNVMTPVAPPAAGQ